MCGIAGLLRPGGAAPARDLAASMADALAHRGPDDRGSWADEEAGVALGHRRLSIVDLTPEGHQPMVSASGRYVVTYNGEVYNHADLRAELERAGRATSWHGHSDTEVFLAALDVWGLLDALERTIGMFALAVWDRQERRLTLVRDRLGIKPLYYGTAQDGALLFGSELKALRRYPAFQPSVDRESMALLLRYGAVPAPRSIYRDVQTLPPGSLVHARLLDGRVVCEAPQPWWSAIEVAREGLVDPFRGTAEDAIEELDALIRSAVRLRMLADVPVGALLSGGVDSSMVVAAAQAQASEPVRTFTIGSDDPRMDESREAAAVASHLGTQHTLLTVSPQDALDLVPTLAEVYDEPFADASQIPTMLVSRLARREVTVALSGDGGDELFGGYTRHVWAGRLDSSARWLPSPVRGLAAAALRAPSAGAWDRAYGAAAPVLPRSLRQRHVGDKVHKLAASLEARTPSALREQAVALWPAGETPVREAEHAADALPGWGGRLDEGDPTTRMLFEDLVTYLPDDILTKVDRASMAYALEARVPLLDHRVVAFAYRLPSTWKVRDGRGKWILRQVLARYLPDSLIDRPKTGFGIPVDEWLRGPLRPWAEDLLAPARIEASGLHVEPILRRWAEHLSGRRNWMQSLWAVLMLQAWLEREHEVAA